MRLSKITIAVTIVIVAIVLGRLWVRACILTDHSARAEAARGDNRTSVEAGKHHYRLSHKTMGEWWTNNDVKAISCENSLSEGVAGYCAVLEEIAAQGKE